MSGRNLPGGKGRPHHHLSTDCLENVEALTSHKPVGLHGLLQDIFILFIKVGSGFNENKGCKFILISDIYNIIIYWQCWVIWLLKTINYIKAI
jgi:hypothetical protein